MPFQASNPHNITIDSRQNAATLESTCNYLNLLTMTAIISSTSTVIIAMVTILFVAILMIRQYESSYRKSP